MDSNTLVTIVVSGLLGFFMVKFFQIRKELAKNELDRRLDDIYSDMGRMRDHIDKEIENVTEEIRGAEKEVYNYVDQRMNAVARTHNELDRQVSELYNMVSEDEATPTLFDNVAK
jgi:hypothetical protein